MSQATSSHLVDSSNQPYALGREIASGGEGSIHEVKGKANLVIKLYNREVQRNKQLGEIADKVQYMVNHAPQLPEDLPTDSGHHYWTWPLESLFSEGQLVGYLMPKITGIKGEEFLQFSSGFSWKARVMACRNLVALVQATHQAGYIIGDLNPRNLFFTPVKNTEAILPSITDTDSFQVGVGGGEVLFPCKVQNPEYSAPELIETLAKDRTLEQDYFTLAIVLFQILSLGVHPFSGVMRGAVNQEIRLNILKNRNVLFSRDLIRPKAMIDLEVFPSEMITLFDKTFRKGHTVTKLRATTDEWLGVLDEVITELETCIKNPRHFYGCHLGECPWCSYASRISVDPFDFQPMTTTSQPSRATRPQSPRVLDAGSGNAGSLPSFQRTAPQTITATSSGSGPNTLFGPVPDDLKPEYEGVSSTRGVKANSAQSKSKAVHKTQTGKKKRRLFVPFLGVFLLALAALSAWLYFNKDSQLFMAYVKPLLERFVPSEPTPLETTSANEIPVATQVANTASLTITTCIDENEPYDCSGNVQSMNGGKIIPFVEDVVFQQAVQGNLFIFTAKDLTTGNYTLKLDDSTLRATHVRCDGSAENQVRLTLKENTALTFAYCKKVE
jgi:serine/threonine protein kinase